MEERVNSIPFRFTLAHADRPDGRLREAAIRTLFSETWIGEYGRGCRVQGIWMDNDLTRFFTRLLVAPGRQLYPYYPYLCKYRTVCGTPLGPAEADRDAPALLLARTLGILEPALGDIQAALTYAAFSEDLPVFRALQPLVDGGLTTRRDRLSVRAYLNDQGRKEYEIEDHTPAA